MKPKELIQRWVAYFNTQDIHGLMSLYHENSINHQTPTGLIQGKNNIRDLFEKEFDSFEIVCIIENIFEDGNWGILEWKDPKGLRGCGFFQFERDKIILQRGYWDKLTFQNQQVPD